MLTIAQLRALTRPLTQAEIDALNGQYKVFIDRCRRQWLQKNNKPPSFSMFGGGGLYELDPEERARVDRVIRNWGKHITPIAERWWRRRGFGIRWPDKSSDPCQFFKLETAES